VELMLVNHVFNEFQSPAGFLRARVSFALNVHDNMWFFLTAKVVSDVDTGDT
jgi:hypothetical protein